MINIIKKLKRHYEHVTHKLLKLYKKYCKKYKKQLLKDIQKYIKDVKKIHYKDDKLLKNITPYYETDKFIATHAGLTPDVPWQKQMQELEMVALDVLQGIYSETPPQWFSFSNANYPYGNKSVSYKTIISGHSHNLPVNSSDRITDYGRRVRLASHLNYPDRHPLDIWQDWDGGIITVP